MSSVRLKHAGYAIEDAVAMATASAGAMTNDDQVNDVADETDDGGNEHNPGIKLNFDSVHNLVNANDSLNDEPGDEHPND